MNKPKYILGSLQAHAACIDVIRGGIPRVSEQPTSDSPRLSKCVIVGKIWKSEQNGLVYDPNGLSPCLTVGHHSGVEPKIIVYEKD